MGGSMLERKQDCSTIKHNEDDNKVEVHLDTSGYKPDELKVQVEGSTVRVEGKHEERSQAGAVMVSRQFVKEYALPGGASQRAWRAVSARMECWSSQCQSQGRRSTLTRVGVCPSLQVTDLLLCNYLPSVSILPKAFSALYF